ncbi:MAG: hypothetical protein A2511_16590 [Deltaproteobacteria bacterium RIFOXYD12_FULL_50_9]|nr:MAG: hypothetical protein A2511_16590 [Deltaproteobacteria bacterium RIFOXYD12_FULL_50_9]
MHCKSIITRISPLIFVGMIIAFSIVPVWAIAAEPTENAVKAAYLYNFAQFVDWPPDTWTSSSEPFNVCILGDNPFGRALETIHGKTIKMRKVSVVLIDKPSAVDHCQVLFISQSINRQVEQIIKQVDRRPILTISDMVDFVQAGGMIGLFTDEGRIQFEINNSAAEQAGLTISSHLLRLGNKGGRHD